MFNKQLSNIITKSNLKEAYLEISKKSYGLDGVSFKKFEKDLSQNLKTIVFEVEKGIYSPEPLKKIEIDKPNSDKKRPIALSAIKDKIVQKALYSELSPYFEKDFSNKSYAYRPNKSTIKAINRVTETINKKYFHIVKTDIEGFFENIDHDILLEILSFQISDKKIIRLLSLFMQVGGFSNLDYDEHIHGIHQGDILSPMLSNIYLDAMDKYLEKHKVMFVRYADDFVMLFKSKDEAKSRLNLLKKYLASMKLKLGADKTTICHISDGFVFLGVEFHGRNRQVQNERLQKSISKIHTYSKSKVGFMRFIDELNTYLYALKNYYLKIVSKNSIQHRLLQDALIDSLAHKVFLSKSSKDITTKKEFKILLDKVHIDILFDDKISENIELIIAKGYEKYLAEKSYKEPSTKIDKKKNQYAKKFANDSTLHVASKGMMLGISKNRFVIKLYGKVQSSYPFDRVTRVIVEGKGLLLSSDVIKRCADNNITVDFISRDALSYASLITYKASLSQNIHNQASLINTPKQLELAISFIRGKAKNQLNYIKYLNKYHKLLAKQIDAISKTIKKIDIAKSVEELMGYEGSISVSYWQALRLVLEVPFEKRVTFGAKDVVNSSLNYGYAILYGKIQHSLVHAGLSLNISFLHAMDNKKPTLTFDMIEEFRTFVVDRTIITMLNKEVPIKLDSKGLLTKSSRQQIAKGIKEKLGSYTMHKKQSKKVEHIIQAQAFNLAKVVDGSQKKYKVFIGKY